MAGRGELRVIVFEEATSERGPFFSERDHVRMADLLDFGVEIYWCNETFRRVSRLCLKDRRAFFVPVECAERFDDAFVIAIYGSTIELTPEASTKVCELLSKLRELFGENVSFLTGGGGGLMKLVLDTGAGLGCMVGSNFLENADQNLDSAVGFYQTFQSSARHMRQRWFEVARFHLFCIGGVGTLEEIGLTLTDIKLGLLNTEPVVFFGASDTGLYWHDLRAQLNRIVAEGRGPRWLKTNVLVTDSPEKVVAFYEHILRLQARDDS
jgi:predicted Rossmann-fold nucleotide-binding protein